VTLNQLAKRLDGLANSTEELCEVLANRSLKLIQDGFREERDPRGVAWAPRRSGERRFTAASFSAGGAAKQGKARRGHKLLDLSGKFKGDFHVIGVNRAGFAIGNPTSYGGYLQHGTSSHGASLEDYSGGMPARMTVPGTGEGLGTWADPLQEEARAFIRKKLGVK
jgi:hypothetical protein